VRKDIKTKSSGSVVFCYSRVQGVLISLFHDDEEDWDIRWFGLLREKVGVMVRCSLSGCFPEMVTLYEPFGEDGCSILSHPIRNIERLSVKLADIVKREYLEHQ